MVVSSGTLAEVSPGMRTARAKTRGSLSPASTGTLQILTHIGPQEPRVHFRKRRQGFERAFITRFRVGQRVDEQNAFAAQHAQSAALAAKLLAANGDSGGFGRGNQIIQSCVETHARSRQVVYSPRSMNLDASIFKEAQM